MKILIISGFLGGGKTTFIQEFIKKVKKNIVILENEYGDVNIDGKLFNNEIEVREMTEGCICCTVKADFALSILTIANTLNPEILIVEPSGVGKLSAILENIGKVTYDRIELLAPITVVDVNSIDILKKEYYTYFTDQIKHANMVLLTKNENSKNEVLDNVKKELSKYIDENKIETEHYNKKEKTWWNDLIYTKWDKEKKASITLKRKDENLTPISFKNLMFNSTEEFLSIMNAIIRGDFGSIYRGKGSVEIVGQKYKFDLVSDNLNIESTDLNIENTLVLIGKDLDIKKLNILFDYYSKIHP